MSTLTPKQIIDHFNRLSPADKSEFIKLLARQSLAEDVLSMWGELPATEQERFNEAVIAHLGQLDQQLEKAQYRAHLQKVFDAGTGKDIPKEIVFEYLHDHAEEQVNSRRNRQPDPETIAKNVAMCDAKLRNPKLTLGQISQQFHVTRQHVSAVLKEEERWRRLAKGVNRLVD